VNACKAIEVLSCAMDELSENMVDDKLPPQKAFLFPVDEEEVSVSVAIHPATRLLLLNEKQRKIFLSFLEQQKIAVDAFFLATKLDMFCVTTDRIILTLANGCGGCWELLKIPLGKMTNAELYNIILPAYELYVACCKFLALEPRSINSVIRDVKYYL